MFAIGLILFFIAMALLSYGFEPALKAKDWAGSIYSGIGLLLCGGAWLAARFIQKKYFPVDIERVDVRGNENTTWQGVLVQHNPGGSALIIALGHKSVFAQASDEILLIPDNSFPEDSRILPQVKMIQQELGVPENMP